MHLKLSLSINMILQLVCATRPDCQKTKKSTAVEDLPEIPVSPGQGLGDSESKHSCAPKGVSPPKIICSEKLFDGTKLLVINHAGEQYRLSITKNNKLILQK